MQISLNEKEITEAVTKQVLEMISLKANQNITVDFTAGRGTNGLTANIEINDGATSSKPVPRTAIQAVPSTQEEEDTSEPEAAETPEPVKKSPVFGKPKSSGAQDELTEAEAPAEDSETEGDASEEAEAPADKPANKSIFAKKKAS